MRDIMDRVQTAAPFLRFDADPYPVVLDGRLKWVVDGYTTTSRYPYAQSIHPASLPGGSGLDADFNYVRNSVKATVDAYDGTVTFYDVSDDNDPLIKAYEKAFPNLFTSGKDAPTELIAHWRYPEDMFRAQTQQYALYHMTDTRQFYNKGDLWDIAPNPAQTATADTGTTATTASGNNGGRNSTRASETVPIDPLYQTLQLPGESGEEFVLTRPFVPIGKSNQLTAFMAARSDPGHYGQLVVYNTPDNSTVPSPSRAASLIESQEQISKTFSLIDQRGSTVLRGSVQLIPIGDSILYLRPIWVEGTAQSTYPRYRFVAMAYGQEKAVLASTVSDGIKALFGQGPVAPSENGNGGTTTGPGGTGNQPPATVAELLQKAADEFAAAKKVQGTDLGAYQDHIKKAQDYVDQAMAQLESGGSTGSGSSSSSTTTTAPRSGSSTSTTAATTTTTAGA
jgi:uncharacterized membrane protein (UPF0182 family)